MKHRKPVSLPAPETLPLSLGVTQFGPVVLELNWEALLSRYMRCAQSPVALTIARECVEIWFHEMGEDWWATCPYSEAEVRAKILTATEAIDALIADLRATKKRKSKKKA